MFLKSFTLALLLFGAFACSDEKDIYNRETGNREYLNYAIDAGEWIISTSDSNGVSPDDYLLKEKISQNIGAGEAGRVIFFIELYKSTGDEKYLQRAVKGGEYLLGNLPQNAEAADTIRSRHTFYGGLAGISFTLSELFRFTNNPKFDDGSRKIFEFLKSIGEEENGRISYSPYNDLLNGNTGAGLYFIDYYRKKKDETALEVAEKIAGHLMGNSIETDSGLTWRYNQEREFILPNFSHGTAGIGFFFNELFEITGKEKYLETATAAAKYLISIAKTDSSYFMVPYGFPLERWENYYDIGWAHGPAGTARFFYSMWKSTDDYKYLTIVRKCAQAIMNSGLPGAPAEKDFGENPFYIDMRFGQASAANFFMDLYHFDNDEKYYNYAKLLADDLIKKSTSGRNGIYWEFDRYAFFENGGEPAQFTGYFYGAAGFGMTLLHLDKITNGGKDFITLPDNPFKFDFETITFKSGDSLLITADLYETDKSNLPFVVLFHRSASSRGQYRKIAPRLMRGGYNVLAVDTRWGGRKSSFNIVDNRTGERNGSYGIIDSYPLYKGKRKEWQEKIWPILNDSYMDIKSSVNWVKKKYNGKVFVLGSSISSIFTLKLASEEPDMIDGVIAYSPGEYKDSDTAMVAGWASEIEIPVLIVSAASEAELEMTAPIYEIIPSPNKYYFKAEKGMHGSSILLEDEKNWQALIKFLSI